MDKTTLNAPLVKTGLKRVFNHLKSGDCERSDLWKSFGCQWKEWPAWFFCMLDLSSGVKSRPGGFFVSDVISGGISGHLGPLHLALGSNR